MRRVLFLGLIVAASFVALLWAGQYDSGPFVITKQYEFRVVLRFGNPVGVLTEPGLSLRIPLVDQVLTFDRRIQYLNVPAVEMLIANNEKLIVDYYAVWVIDDPRSFLERYTGLKEVAERRIQEVVTGVVGANIAALDLDQLLQRSDVLQRLAEESNRDLAGTGVHVVDVRLNRTEIPARAEPAAFAQMREQRHARAREYRVRGERDAREIRAQAERVGRTVLAKARGASEVLRGEGDAEAAAIYADAYSKDPEFYAFVRSLEAYRKSLKENTTMVLAPDHEFFRFLEPSSSWARSRTPPVSAPPPGPAEP